MHQWIARRMQGRPDLQCVLTFALSTICMDGRARVVEIEQVIINEVGRTLRVDEDDGTSRRRRLEKVREALLLTRFLGKDNLEESAC